MRYLLLTECLQNDFVGPLAPGAPIGSSLHIGRAESRRLLGDPEGAWQTEGPLARFLAGWQATAGPNHAAVHIRDWHDPADAATQAHLDHFGRHCVRGTEGADFVEPLQNLLARPGNHVVESAILSDFVGTNLEATLRPLVSAGPVRAGLIGVWTDVKVHYLAYDLMTRLGLSELAVCGALTASRSRLQHRQALEHMASTLGVTVFDSIPEFAAWLGLGGAPAAALRGRSRPDVLVPDGVALDDEERRLVEYLFRDCREVRLEPLSGGFSGSRVFRSASLDRQGLSQVAYVVKTDTHARIAQERVSVESVETLLGAASPRLSDYVDLETRGAIKYQFASMHGGPVRTLQKSWRELRTPEEVRALFGNVVSRVLSRLYQRPQLEPVQIFRHYGFSPAYAASTLARVDRLAERVSGDKLWVAGLADALPHPHGFYAGLADRLAEEPLETACCWVHGDLNLANLLLDGGGNVWMIDYFWTRVAHALMDIAKLENDIKFILLPVHDDEALRRAAEWDELLVGQADLGGALPELPASLAGNAELGNAHAAVSALRELGARLLAEAGVAAPRSAREYHVAQLRYAAHTLSFDECDERQKRLALVSLCSLARSVGRTGKNEGRKQRESPRLPTALPQKGVVLRPRK